jgi:hypothetical protein
LAKCADRLRHMTRNRTEALASLRLESDIELSNIVERRQDNEAREAGRRERFSGQTTQAVLPDWKVEQALGHRGDVRTVVYVRMPVDGALVFIAYDLGPEGSRLTKHAFGLE